MTPERWSGLERLFHAALERSPGEERARFVEASCAGDAELRAQLEALLRSHERAGESFMESPVLATEADAELPAGTRLGPYAITSLLGRGGMGEIYRARDTRLDRDVAVKVLPAALARDPERLSRFEQEARAASALNHPHIVALHDVGRDKGLAYIVTELLEGETLAERMAHGPRPIKRALEHAVQAARGLAAAHERGIVHRDVKPANLFLTNDGQLKILDFGLAKLADRAPAHAATMPGLVMGTVGYMSPEQVRGEPVDFRSDQFSLGCVIYELLTGEAAFRRSTGAQTLAAVIEDEPPPIETKNPRVPKPVAWVVERCLAKDPDERYAATRDLARDLELAIRRHADSGAEKPTAAARARRGLHPAALFALPALLLGVAAGAWLLRPKPPPVPIVRFLTYSGRDTSPAASPDGTTVVFSSTRDGRRRLWLKQLATGSELPLTDGDDDNPRFSADGSTVLFSRSAESRVSLYRVAVVGGEPRKLVDDALYGDFAPDGRRISFLRQFVGGGGEMMSVVGIADLDGGRARELARFPGRALVHPRWSPDGRMLALSQNPLQVGEPTRIALVDAETGAVRWLALLGAAGVSPGGLVWAGARTLAYAQPESVVGVQTGTSSRVVLHDVRSAKSRPVFWSSANTRMLDVLGPGRIVLESRSLRGNLREFTLGSTGKVPAGHWLSRGNSTDRQPSYSPDGEWIVFSSNRAGNLDLWALSRRSGAVRRLTDDAAQDWDPGFTRDGRLLWSSNRTGRFEVWTADADGTGARQLTNDGVDAENPVATPDGWVVYASANPRTRGIMRIRADGSRPARIVAGNLILPEVSPDGQYLAFVANQGSERAALRVARVADGALTRFEFLLPAWIPGGSIDLGRSRWFPDGRAIAFIGRVEPQGALGVYVQDFRPDADTRTSRRLLLPVDAELPAESFAISPDGRLLTVAYSDPSLNLIVAENVAGIERLARPAR